MQGAGVTQNNHLIIEAFRYQFFEESEWWSKTKDKMKTFYILNSVP